MKDHCDSSILGAALVDSESHHAACLALLRRGQLRAHVHALVETFNTLTGGRHMHRVLPSVAADILECSVLPRVETFSLSAREIVSAMKEAEGRGVRGGAIYDYLHLVAARRGKSRRIYTLDVSDFRAFHRHGDPEIVHP